MTKHRRFAPQLKAHVVLEELAGIKDRSEIWSECQLTLQAFSD